MGRHQHQVTKPLKSLEPQLVSHSCLSALPQDVHQHCGMYPMKSDPGYPEDTASGKLLAYGFNSFCVTGHISSPHTYVHITIVLNTRTLVDLLRFAAFENLMPQHLIHSAHLFQSNCHLLFYSCCLVLAHCLGMGLNFLQCLALYGRMVRFLFSHCQIFSTLICMP